MSLNTPKVSILSSSYNHVNFIDDFITSVYNQDYTNFELLMIDDGSSDGCADRLKELSEKYQFKAIIRKNKGFPNALNTLRPLATGDYIVIIAADDMMTKDRLTQQVEFLEKNKTCAIVASNMQEIDEAGNKGDLISKPFLKGNIFKELLLTNTYILAPTVMIRKSCLDAIGVYDENLMVEDFDMWLRLSKEYTFGHLDFLAAYYRKHSNNSHGNYKVSYQQKELVLEKYKGNTWYNEAVKIHNQNAFLFLSRLKDFQDLAKVYKTKAKAFGRLEPTYIKACIKYYLMPKV